MIPSPPSSVFKRVFICSDIEWTSVTPPPLMVPENERNEQPLLLLHVHSFCWVSGVLGFDVYFVTNAHYAYKLIRIQIGYHRLVLCIEA